MSYYTEREVFIKEEGTWGTEATPTSIDVINYLLSCELTSAERRADEFVIGGARDARSRAWLQREVTGALEFQPTSGKIFYFGLGKASGGATPATGLNASIPCTITPTTVVPSLTIWRAAREPEEWVNTWGNKVDRLELNIEQGEDITCVCDLAGKDADLTDHSWVTPDIKWTIDPLSFYHSTATYKNTAGTSTIDHLRSARIEIRNNLEARFSAGAGTFVCQELREGGLEVTGRVVVDYPFSTFTTYIVGRNEGTLTFSVGSTKNGTMTITLNNIIFEELPSVIRGLDVMELDLPFVARKPSATGTVMTVVVNHPTATVLNSIPF